MPVTYHKMPLSDHLDRETLFYFMDSVVRAGGFTTFVQEPMSRAVTYAPLSPPAPKLCQKLLYCQNADKPCNVFLKQSLHQSVFGGPTIVECPLGLKFAVGALIFARGACTSALISGYVRTSEWTDVQFSMLDKIGSKSQLGNKEIHDLAEAVPLISKQKAQAVSDFVNITANYLMSYCVLKDRRYDDYLKSDFAVARKLMRDSNLIEQAGAEAKYSGNYDWKEEYDLIQAVAVGHRDKAQQKLVDILANLYLHYLDRPIEFKGRVMELAVLITRAPLYHQHCSEGNPLSLHMLPELYPPVGSSTLAMKQWVFVVLDQVLDAIDCVQERDFRAQTVRTALGYINANLGKRVQMEDVANEIGFSSNHLGRIFREEVGVSISEYITKAKIEEAKKLLRISTMSITEISEKLSYWDSTHFAKVFRKSTGITPSEYRSQQAETLHSAGGVGESVLTH